MTFSMFGNILRHFYCHSLDGGASQVVESKKVAKHPTMLRTTPPPPHTTKNSLAENVRSAKTEKPQRMGKQNDRNTANGDNLEQGLHCYR